MRETQYSVWGWANATFGFTPNNFSKAVRANVEMAELLTKLAADNSHPDAIEEAADVVIVLMHLAENMKKDLFMEVDRKMAINRDRRWTLDGNGHGQHIP